MIVARTEICSAENAGKYALIGTVKIKNICGNAVLSRDCVGLITIADFMRDNKRGRAETFCVRGKSDNSGITISTLSPLYNDMHDALAWSISENGDTLNLYVKGYTATPTIVYAEQLNFVAIRWIQEGDFVFNQTDERLNFAEHYSVAAVGESDIQNMYVYTTRAVGGKINIKIPYYPTLVEIRQPRQYHTQTRAIDFSISTDSSGGKYAIKLTPYTEDNLAVADGTLDAESDILTVTGLTSGVAVIVRITCGALQQ